MAGRERRPARDPDLPETRDRPGRDRQDKAGGVGLVVDVDLLLAQLRQRETLLAKRDLQRRARGDDVLRDDRVAGLDRKSLAKLACLFARGIQARKLDRLENILTARFGGERDEQRALARLDARLDHRIVIAARTEQLGEKLGVGARTAIDLGGVDRLTQAFAKRRLGVKRLDQRRLIVDSLKTGQRQCVAVFRGRIDRWLGGRFGCLDRLDRGVAVHVRPFDAEIGQGIERRRWIELCRAGGLGKDGRGRPGHCHGRTGNEPRLAPRFHELKPSQRS